MRRSIVSALAVFSAFLLALALPNDLFEWGSPLIGLIALTPLYMALRMTKSYGEGFIVGALFGGFAHGLSSYWLWFFHGFKFWTLGSTVVAYMLIYGVFAWYLRAAVKRGGYAAPVLFACVWILCEWGKSTGFLAYPWGLLAYSWNTVLPAIQISDATGVYGLSFTLVYISAAAAELAGNRLPADRLLAPDECAPCRSHIRRLVAILMPPRCGMGAKRHCVAALSVMCCVLIYGAVSLSRDRTPRASFKALIVQANLNPWDGNENENIETAVSMTGRAIEAGAAPDVVFFTETFLVRPWRGFEDFYAAVPQSLPLSAMLSKHDVYLLTGLPNIRDYKTFAVSNAVALINPAGDQVAVYNKMHAVPFAESIPFWDWEPFRRFMERVVGITGVWTMGSEYTIFTMDTKSAGEVHFGAPICFEDAFAPLCRNFVKNGAEVLINLTNDSWSERRSAEMQHFIAARFRAVELRRTLVRSTNGGVSALVDPSGRVTAMLPLFSRIAEQVDVPVYTAETSVYLRYGDLFTALVACYVLFCMAALIGSELCAMYSCRASRRSSKTACRV